MAPFGVCINGVWPYNYIGIKVIPLFCTAHCLLGIALRLQRWRWFSTVTWRDVMMVPFVVQMVLITIVITFPCLKVVCLETHPSPLVQNAHLKMKLSLSCLFAITWEQWPPSPFLLICFLLIMATQKIIIQSTPDNSNLQGKSKKVWVIGSSSYRELEQNSRE